ncbi:MAG: hypothetical protein ISEC1_P0652 [Thiomicrorhabdus sp.]|nr:MAG: hypothetical protein ISEC1_P0652 [Thiomicrorhabdus sp.]
MAIQDADIDWIQLELVPLPRYEEKLSRLLLWWNPTDRKIVGEGAESILSIILSALDADTLKGSVASGLADFKLVDPLSSPTELAAILAQYFWVIPTPVKSENALDYHTEASDRLQ